MKKKTKKTKTRKRKITKKKKNIIDVPIAKYVSKGSEETDGDMFYKYTNYNIIFLFFKYLLNNNTKLKEILCFPQKIYEWNNIFINIYLDKKGINNKQKLISKFKSNNIFTDIDNVKTIINNCEINNCRFFIFIFALTTNMNVRYSHANIVIGDIKEKTVELFEPHGKRHYDSELDELLGAYNISDKLIKKFFKHIIPNYKYISPQIYLPSKGLQGSVDAFSGICITWTMLYLHYRILNPQKNKKTIINHLKTLKRNFILRYIKYVELEIKKNYDNDLI
jgi:hypothetical protein